MNQFCTARKQWDSHQLSTGMKPKFHHSNKEFLFKLAFSKGISSNGSLGYSRWSNRPLPILLPGGGTEILQKPGFFDYEVSSSPQVAEWHMNFANNEIFSAWATSLLAQDELQVAEHPALIGMRIEAMKEGISLWSVEDGAPTPILITGVERRLSVDTSPNEAAGRPYGIYGNYFRNASESQITSATTVITPPTKSNILAIEAPAYGSGRYTSNTIIFILSTAYSGFSAVLDESQLSLNASTVRIHSGFWGCGAYGGNRVLMLLLQMVAARLAGIDQITFHTGDGSGSLPFRESYEIYQRIQRENLPVDQVIDLVAGYHFEWGESDGN